jgi:hypothetical protein
MTTFLIYAAALLVSFIVLVVGRGCLRNYERGR